MNLTLPVFLLTYLCFTGCSNAQTGSTIPVPPDPKDYGNKIQPAGHFEYSLATAHPHAQALMKEDFYWSPIEETGPFGNDDGWEAAQEFHRWRMSNKSASPLVCLRSLIIRWEYPYFDWHELDTQKIKTFMVSSRVPDEATIQQRMQLLKKATENWPDSPGKKMDDARLRQTILTSARQMNGVYLLGQDNAIIATGFAQFALEGRIEKDTKTLTIIALKRQLLPLLIDRYDDDYRPKRKLQLTKMLEVINKASS